MCHAMETILHQMAQSLPSHRRLRVLEIAAGPSEVPRAVLSMLPEDRLDYVLALPEAASERQQAEYAHHSNLTIATLDRVSWQLTADKTLPGAFDVVLVRHVLHQAISPKASLGQARRWLAAGGCLLVAERYPDWSADFMGGLDSAWWHKAVDSDLPLSSLLPPAAWAEALKSEGFEDVLDFSEPAADGLAEGAYLLLAQRSKQDVVTVTAPESDNWLLLTDPASSDLAEHLRIRLESQGQQVETTGQLPAQGFAGIRHVVNLRGWNAVPESSASLLAEALGDVNVLAENYGKTPRLWFVTRGGALISDQKTSCAPSPAQAALWGFGRVVMNEYPALDCTLIDLACDPSAVDTLNRLENELLRPDGANEIVLSDAGRYVPVLREEMERESTPAAEGERFRLDFHLTGQLRNLLWLPQAERQLSEGEIEIRVQATGLNFRDVMYLMGLLPDEAVEKGFAGASLGLEFAGIVSRVGQRVRDLRVGDKVMGFGSACFASHVVTRADAVALMPEEWSFESAATVPTVFFTVYYALKHLADLQAGERVLIHGGAGGVGIAAIQLAKYLGAEVFATAGSPEKRDFVRLLGADHVFDSRSLAFADDILAATNGEGIDVVLNSLAGEVIRRNLSVLKPFGRFLELGKRDFFENTPIGLRPFKDNISYFGIDADQLLTGRPQLAARLFREVMALFREGALTPLPCRVFPAGRVVDAFRVMQQSRHIGKVVVSLADAHPAIERPAQAPQRFALSKESTWLVTGGLSGFGLESARWLAAHGVGHLVLLGRRGLDTPGAKDAIDDLAARGINVQALACDITDGQAVEQVVERVRKTCPPLKGIVHAAAAFCRISMPRVWMRSLPLN
jgi:NADPH:quinone reductase-like Zn-dependent oxidoreductase/SAM-dependent methyltransferase